MGVGAAAAAKMMVSLVVLILVLVGLYYLYKFLYGSQASVATVTILGAPTSMSSVVADISGSSVSSGYVAKTKMTGIVDGGAYTVNMWAYVNSTATATKLLHLLDISNGRDVAAVASDSTLLFIGLDPKNGALIVRQSTSDNSYKIDNQLVSSGLANSYIPGTNFKYSIGSLLDNYQTDKAGAGNYSKDDKCDILNGIEYQRWVQITVVANGRTLDVYLDGKLARSCVYNANFALNSTKGTATAYVGANTTGDLKGYFSNITYSNYAFTPANVWTSYQAGPGGAFDIKTFFANLFSTNGGFSSLLGITQ
jgi:hypothetical protein